MSPPASPPAEASATPRPYKWQPWISTVCAAFAALPLRDDVLRGNWWWAALDVLLVLGNAFFAYDGFRALARSTDTKED